MIDWLTDHFDHVDYGSSESTEDYIRSVIDYKGLECGNCGEWRLLNCEDEIPRTIEQCQFCGDEAFDIYEAAEEGP